MLSKLKIAEDLLEIKAVRFQIEPPFQWSSGWNSPIYCDNRIILSYPAVRTRVKEAYLQVLRDQFPQAQGIVGVATGAIALAALIAEEMNLPMIYVRSKAKSHGMQNLVEGQLDPQLSYVVIEDLISTGKSSLQAVEAIRKEGATVLGAIAVFSYEFPIAKQHFQAAHCPYATLTNMKTLLSIAEQSNYLRPDELVIIQDWQREPETWVPNITS